MFRKNELGLRYSSVFAFAALLAIDILLCRQVFDNIRIANRKFILSFDLISVSIAQVYLLACFQPESTL